MRRLLLATLLSAVALPAAAPAAPALVPGVGSAAPLVLLEPREWLAGDLHAHSCFSHDVYCGPQDDNTGPEEFYTFGERVDQRFFEAAVRGLDFLAITDHGDTRSAADPAFGSLGVLGIPGYENSVRGHMQVLGTDRVLDHGDDSADAIVTLRDELHALGGVMQANHPGYRADAAFTACEQTDRLHWRYGYAVVPDTIEVLNPTSPARDAERYLECWLDRGARIGVTGGSDNHWQSLAAVGIGYPTTWVLAASRSRTAVLEALREGRTAVSGLPPADGGAPLLLEADPGRDGTFEAVQGDSVPSGSPLRVRSLSPAAAGTVRVRGSGGVTLLEERLAPGGEVRFAAPAGTGWVRASLLAAGGVDVGCDKTGQSISTCSGDKAVLGLTSPLYLAAG